MTRYPSRQFAFALCCLALTACGAYSDQKRSNQLEMTLRQYESAIRWGYFDYLSGFTNADAKAGSGEADTNIRVTSYETLQPAVITEEGKALQTVRIHYIHNDRQVVRTLVDRQTWAYDEDKSAWFLKSRPPVFQ
jgi:hypothetical protein